MSALGGKQTLRESGTRAILARMKQPETQFIVEVTVDDENCLPSAETCGAAHQNG
jgi:hypothetical protein